MSSYFNDFNVSTRIGVKPIFLPSELSYSIDGSKIVFLRTSDKFSVEYFVSHHISFDVSDSFLRLIPSCDTDSKFLGLHRANISNLVCGLVKPFVVNLDLVGVGYKASLNGKYISIALGFSHQIKYAFPDCVNVSIPKNSVSIELSSYSKDRLGIVVSDLCNIRRYNPYSGKGILVRGKSMIRRESKR